jgi:FkbM family methyltransferase
MLKKLFKILRFITSHSLTKNQKIRTLLRFFRWQLNCVINPYPIIYPFVENSLLLIKKGQTAATGNLYVGLLEFNEMMFVLHFLRKEDLFIDVGANIGTYTILATKVIEAETIAFEPIKKTFDQLVLTVALNNINDKVTLYNLAIGEITSKVSMTCNNDTTNCISPIVDYNQENTEIVMLETLDNLINNREPAIIKIDVEGYEKEVLKGALKILKKESLCAIIIETNFYPHIFSSISQDIYSIMNSFGFYPYQYNPFKRELFQSNNKKSNNTIFIRNSTFVESRICNARKIKVLNKHI